MQLSLSFGFPRRAVTHLLALPALIPVFALLAILAALSFSGRAIVTKAGGPVLPLGPLLLVQGLMSLPISMVMAKSQRVRLIPGATNWKAYASRITAGLSTFALQVYCVQIMPASLASTLTYTAPLFTAILAPFVLNESTRPITLLLTMIGFVGISLNAAPHLHAVSAGSLALGLAAGVTSAWLQLSNRQLGASGEPALRGVFLTHIATTLVGAVLCLLTSAQMLTAGQLAICFGIALLNTIGQLAMAAAYTRGNALPVNALSFLTLPFTLILAVLLLGEHVGPLAILGVSITLPSCLALVCVEHFRAKARREATVSMLPENCEPEVLEMELGGLQRAECGNTSAKVGERDRYKVS